ncbi:MAG: efflux RND transporter permease subunit [Alkalispirochaetaceae bacterium]
MFLSKLSIHRPVMMTMLLASLLLFGLIGFLGLSLNLMPEVEIPFVTVQTVYPGASPDQVATQITRLIEDEVSTVSQIDNIQSYSLDSASIIILEFALDKDPDVATQEVKDKVDLIINELPSDAEAPLVEKVDITALPVVNLVLSGDVDPVELSEIAETSVRDQLSRIAGVGRVSVSGSRDREIRVEFENRVIYENQVSLAQVGQILAMANLDMPGGNLETRGQDFSVRLEGQFAALEDVADLEIPTGGGPKRLGSIATIRDTGEDVRSRTIFFDNRSQLRDENSVLIGIVKAPEGNPVEIAEEVRELLPSLERSLPAGVSLTITSDDSEAVEGTVNDTLSNILMGIGLTALVLLLFLHDLRSTLIVALAMPMSIIPTFLVMNAFGMSLNLMSLMGISTAVGVLVMNSVVMLENIFRHKQMGHDRITAADQGTAEVTVAVIASTMTNIAVFLPMATMSGIAGLFLQEFALAVSFATIFSMLISFTLTPKLASKLLPEVDRKKHPVGDWLEGRISALERGYAVALEKVLHSRLRSALLIAATLVLFVLSLGGFARIPFEFQPAMDQGDVRIEVELAPGSDLAQTASLLREIEERVSAYPEVMTAVTNLGTLGETDSGTNLGSMDVKLIDKSLRLGNTTVAARMGEDLADIPGALIRVTGVSNNMGGGAPVLFYLQGDDTGELTALAGRMRRELQEVPGLVNIDTSSKPGRPEFVLLPDRVRLNEAGLTVQDLAMTMRAAVEGIVMTSFREGGEEYDIRVTLRDEDVSGYEEISSVVVPTRAGLFPLGHFAEVDLAQGVNQILREDKIESIEISADLAPGYVLGEVSAPIEAAFDNLEAPPGYRLSWGGDAELLNETVGEFVFVFVLAVILTYMLLAAILERFGQPLLILSTIPLSLIGVSVAFLITAKTMNIVSMLAIVMLVGLVVNNAILILDYANQLRAKGKGVREALLEAAPTKLKPILMANIATMLGMLPMALGLGAWGAEMRQPMGIVSIGGLLAATFLSLFVIPALENLIESRKGETRKVAAHGGTE